MSASAAHRFASKEGEGLKVIPHFCRNGRLVVPPTALPALLTFSLAAIALFALPELFRLHATMRSTPSYTLSSGSFDPGGASFSANYAQRGALVDVAGASGHTPPDSTARLLWHGFVPMLDAPLFAVANVSVTLEVSPILSSPQEPVVCAGTVRNDGPEFAPEVTLTLVLPANFTYLGASLSQGSVSISGNRVECRLGILPAGGVATYSIRVTPTANGTASFALTVAPEAVDLEFGGNSAQAQTAVVTGLHFTLPGGGSWHKASNWTPPIIPTAEHKVFIDGDIVDFYDADATVAGLRLTGGRIGGAHRLTVTTLAEWTGGELQSGTALVIPPGGLLRVTNGAYVNLRSGAGIENHGTVRLESTALHSAFGAWVTNYGVFEVAGNPSLARFESSAFDFHNSAGAIFRKTAGAGVSAIPVSFRNDGLVEVLAGSLDFNGSFVNGGFSLVNRGVLRAVAGTEMRYTKANSFQEGTVFEGPGLHRVIAASVQPGDGSEFNGTIRGDFEIANGRINGTFTHTGNLAWNGGNLQFPGEMTVFRGASLTLAGGGTRTLVNGYAIRNQGEVRLVGAGLVASPEFYSGVLDNYGTLTIDGDHSVSGGLALTNRSSGIIRKVAGTGTSTFTPQFFQQDGRLELWSGTLALGAEFRPGPQAALEVRLRGREPGAGYGQLRTTQDALLAGRLEIVVEGEFASSFDDRFEILTSRARQGTFAEVRSSPVPGGYALGAEYVSAAVRLRLMAGPAELGVPVIVGGDMLRFVFLGAEGSSYLVEATENLGPAAAWVSLGTRVATGAPVVFDDPEIGQYRQRFYRARLQP